jgi:gliding motility-associated-like protein
LQAGTYSLTVTQAGCTSAAGTTTVTVDAPVSVNAGANLASCNGGAVTLNGSFGGSVSSVSWSNGGGTYGNSNQAITSYTPSAAETLAGTATLTLTTNDPTGPSPAASDNMTIVISNSPSANFSYPEISYCQTDIDPSPVFAGGASGGTFSSTGGLVIDPATGIIDLSASAPGTYTVQNDIAANGSCPAATATTNVTIIQNPSAPVLGYNASVCENDTLFLTASTVANANYSWSGPNGFSSTSQNPFFPDAQTVNNGTYTVNITVNGCTSSDASLNVAINTLPIVSIQNGASETICRNDSVTLVATGATTYIWNTNETSSSISVNPSSNSSFIVTGTLNGCLNSDTIQVNVNPLPTIQLGSNANQNGSFCFGSTALLTASGGILFQWTGPNGFTSFSDTLNFAPVALSNVGTYYITVTDANNCVNSDSIDLVAAQSDFANISGDTSLCPGQTLNLSATGGVTYSWTGPNTFVSSNQAITVPNMNTSKMGVYEVIVVDTNGCVDTASTLVSIVVEASCLNIPELVSPNFDGHNDTWDIIGLDQFAEAQVEIFNRWGNLVYSVSPYSKPWEGEINEGVSLEGQSGKVPVGTYFYIIRLNDPDKNEYKGYVELQY